MGKKSAKIPKPPDPRIVAQAQTDSNIQTARENARLNRLQQETPFGDVQFFDTGNQNAPFGVRSSLNRNDQLILNQLGVTGRRQANRIETGLRGDPTDERYLNAILDRVQPRIKQDEEALRTRLANQGISIGSDAFNNEMDRFSRGVNDMRLAAATQAGAEGRANRSQLINEMMGLRGAMPGGMPVSVPQVGVAQTDTISPAMNNYNQQMSAALNAQQQRSGLLGDIAGLAGTIGGAALMGPLGGKLGGSLFGLGAGTAAGGFTNPGALGLAGMSLF